MNFKKVLLFRSDWNGTIQSLLTKCSRSLQFQLCGRLCKGWNLCEEEKAIGILILINLEATCENQGPTQVLFIISSGFFFKLDMKGWNCIFGERMYMNGGKRGGHVSQEMQVYLSYWESFPYGDCWRKLTIPPNYYSCDSYLRLHKNPQLVWKFKSLMMFK